MLADGSGSSRINRAKKGYKMASLLHGDITEKIIGAAFAVHNALGKGLTEKTYENALAVKLRQLGLKVEQQKSLPVKFENQTVGEQIVDVVVEDCVILKSEPRL